MPVLTWLKKYASSRRPWMPNWDEARARCRWSHARERTHFAAAYSGTIAIRRSIPRTGSITLTALQKTGRIATSSEPGLAAPSSKTRHSFSFWSMSNAICSSRPSLGQYSHPRRDKGSSVSFPTSTTRMFLPTIPPSTGMEILCSTASRQRLNRSACSIGTRCGQDSIRQVLFKAPCSQECRCRTITRSAMV